MTPKQLAVPSFPGFGIRTTDSGVPTRDVFPLNPSSPPIKWGDPVKRVSGLLTRCSPTDTYMLGIAESNTQSGILPSTIAQLGPEVNAAGQQLVTVNLATALLRITGRVAGVTAQSILGFHDLAYLSAGITPTGVNTGGSAGAGYVYSYKVTGVSSIGESTAPAALAMANVTTALSGTNYNTITIVQPASKAQLLGYNVYVDLNSAGYLFLGFIPVDLANANVTIVDTGQARGATTVPTVNNSGWVVNEAATSTNIVQITALDPRDPIGTQNGRVEFAIPYAASEYLGNAGA